ncbi:hypothetical protein J6590_057587 [Homalodisca vitripennis]|nr:hypothetical protein J6590_057587 [Homalodisca vitripennis]
MCSLSLGGRWYRTAGGGGLGRGLATRQCFVHHTTMLCRLTSKTLETNKLFSSRVDCCGLKLDLVLRESCVWSDAQPIHLSPSLPTSATPNLTMTSAHLGRDLVLLCCATLLILYFCSRDTVSIHTPTTAVMCVCSILHPILYYQTDKNKNYFLKLNALFNTL